MEYDLEPSAFCPQANASSYSWLKKNLNLNAWRYGCEDYGVSRADVDQNSTVNSIDAMLTLRDSLDLDMSSTNWVTGTHTGDVNCDDDSNSTDAMVILRKNLGLDMSGTGWCVG